MSSEYSNVEQNAYQKEQYTKYIKKYKNYLNENQHIQQFIQDFIAAILVTKPDNIPQFAQAYFKDFI